MTRIFVPSDISKYRQLLMGVAILGVLAAHWYGFQSISTGLFYGISQFLAKLVFTEGLLFLSGFGLYYSFSRNSSVKYFYKKRLIRLYLPFLLLSFPLYLYFLISDEHYVFLTFIEQLTTLYFWVKGNYGGMWYVSVSIMLYFLFPCLYVFIIKSKNDVYLLIKALFVVILLFILNYLIFRFNEGYYDLVFIGLSKMPMFVLGLAFGYFVKNNKISAKQYLQVLVVIIFSYVVLSFCLKNNIWGRALIGMVQKLVFMPVLCLIFRFLEGFKISRFFNSFMSWLGKYSLELYIIHLHLFMFLLKCPLFQGIPIIWKASLAIAVALILCVPTNKFLTHLTQRVRLG